MKTDATQEQIEQVIKEITKCGLRADISKGDYRTVIGLVGDERKIPFGHFATLPGVREARMIETPYKLISREYTRFFKEPDEHMTIKAGNVIIGGDEPVFICGPCAIESKTQLFRIAEGVKKAGLKSCPKEALVDGAQMITPDELKDLIAACKNINKLVAGNNKKGTR